MPRPLIPGRASQMHETKKAELQKERALRTNISKKYPATYTAPPKANSFSGKKFVNAKARVIQQPRAQN
eukprot:1393449-Amorphochlora_amoeboformis.AAC.1